MACYAGWKDEGGNYSRPFSCGKCHGCKLAYARQWAIRCMHEASLYDRNCFITLTFKEPKWSLDYHVEFQPFMRRLRATYPLDDIRYYVVGEYGERSSRGHYHALLFNFDFGDKKLWKGGHGHGTPLFRSAMLEELWPFGFSTIGAVSHESAGYVTRYCTKVLSGDEDAFSPTLSILDPDTGEIFTRVKEFAHMSLGIGREWYKRFKDDMRHTGAVMVNGEVVRAPRYYMERLRREGYGEYAYLAWKRGEYAFKSFKETVPNRLRQRSAVAKAKLLLNKREYETQGNGGEGSCS